MKENTQFVLRVTIIHVITYIVCGIAFSTLFNYDALYQLGNTQYFMRPFDSASSFIGPLIQVARGIIFGLVLLLIRKSVIETKYGWLKLWALMVVLGIINTPGPAPSSIEGIIYTQLPLELHLKGAPEILVQTFLFSFFVANPIKLNASGFLSRNRVPLICAAVAGVLFSLSGVLVAFILNVNVMAGMTDVGALLVMFAAVLIVFFISKWYQQTTSPLKHAILLLVCYLMLAVAPTAYNYLTGSVFTTWLTLVIDIVPVLIVFLINWYGAHRSSVTFPTYL